MTKEQRWGISLFVVSLTIAMLYGADPESSGIARTTSAFMTGLGCYLFTKS
jgi:hypothetical protein